LDDEGAREAVARVEDLLGRVEALDDPAARETALEAFQAVLDLYGEGLDRLVALVAASDDGELARALAGDELVSHLLLVHDLHPEPVEARVRRALESVRPYLESHGGNVELLAVDDGVVRLRLAGSCSGCPSSTVTLKLAIEDAIRKAAPEVEEIEAEGAGGSQPTPNLIQIEVPGPPQSGGAQERDDATAPEASGTEWVMAGGLPELGAAGAGPLVKKVFGERLLFLQLAESIYAYRPECPGCGDPLEGAALDGIELACAACGNRYDVMRAGRCLDAPHLHLEPVPLLVDEAGLVKVAVGAAA
jgi:Fe-S cluster biogenesis protein NfuA/nitrite reductase/ring-hydroxylating ferredoxin subunit